MWGWLREGRPSAAQQAAGWSGALSLPRVLDLDAAGRLRSVPAPELTALRRRHHTFASLDLNGDRSHPLPGVTGAALEIVAEFAPSATGKVGLGVYCSPDGAEQTQITYNFANDCLELDCQQSSLDLTTDRGVSGGPLFRDANAPLRLHVFLDGSVIEVFANGPGSGGPGLSHPARQRGSHRVRQRATRERVLRRPGRPAAHLAGGLGNECHLGRHRVHPGGCTELGARIAHGRLSATGFTGWSEVDQRL